MILQILSTSSDHFLLAATFSEPIISISVSFCFNSFSLFYLLNERRSKNNDSRQASKQQQCDNWDVC